jgi:hypothetical protein
VMCGRRRAQKDGPRVRLYFAHVCKWGSKASCRSGRTRATVRDAPDWLKMKNPEASAVKREAEEDLGKGGDRT